MEIYLYVITVLMATIVVFSIICSYYLMWIRVMLRLNNNLLKIIVQQAGASPEIIEEKKVLSNFSEN